MVSLLQVLRYKTYVYFVHVSPGMCYNVIRVDLATLTIFGEYYKL
jgi:hypothetical protein